MKNDATTQNTTNEMNYTLTVEELFSEIELLLRDSFVATFEKDETQLKMKFLNGQKFTLCLQEDK